MTYSSGQGMKAEAVKKITLATFKKFIRENEGKLFIYNRSDFDGMTDCVTSCKGVMQKVKYMEPANGYARPNTLGIKGVWLVGDSRDYFNVFNDEVFKGIEVSNCCGSFSLAVIK